MVTSESLSVICKLNKPDTGFEEVAFSFSRLDEKVSETVLNQFLPHAKHLKEMYFEGYDDLPEEDKLNVLDLATKIIEEQEESSIEKL